MFAMIGEAGRAVCAAASTKFPRRQTQFFECRMSKRITE